jgi:hypothetical protein
VLKTMEKASGGGLSLSHVPSNCKWARHIKVTPGWPELSSRGVPGVTPGHWGPQGRPSPPRITPGRLGAHLGALRGAIGHIPGCL